MNVRESLTKAPCFSGLGEEFVNKLTTIATPVSFQEGDVVFRESDVANDFYILTEGMVSIEICAPGKGCRRILSLDKGDLLGWSPLLDQGRYTATARAITNSHAIHLNGTKTLAICDDDPHFGYIIMKRVALSISKRLNAARIQLLDLYEPSSLSD